jgi:hypothetical protein
MSYLLVGSTDEVRALQIRRADTIRAYQHYKALPGARQLQGFRLKHRNVFIGRQLVANIEGWWIRHEQAVTRRSAPRLRRAG